MNVPENLTEVLAGDKENSQDVENVDGGGEEDESAAPRMFMLSGYSDAERAEIGSFLERKGVACAPSTSNNCHMRATHLIATKMARSEKMLGSIASGKWILHPSFVDDCKARDEILPEAGFEWGNPANGFVGELDKPLERDLAAAAYRWRLAKVSIVAIKPCFH